MACFDEHMRVFRWILAGGVLGALAGACGGNAEQTGDPGRVPQKHRAAAVACDDDRPPGEASGYYAGAAPPDSETCQTDADCAVPANCSNCRAACEASSGACITLSDAECFRDEHCTRGDNGRCEDFRGQLRCTYDECFVDASCNLGGPCGCENAFWSDANACLAGNCRTDADCGSGGYCSPTFGDCGSYSGVIGYYCHTREDTCLDDADCTDNGGGYCMYRPELAHWACGYGGCVG